MSSTLPLTRPWWHTCFRVTTVVGLLCAVGKWGVLDPAAVVVLVAIMAGLVAASIRDEVSLAAVPSIVGCGLMTGLAGVAAVGLVAVLGLPGVLIVGAILVTWPRHISSARSAWRAVRDGTGVVRPDPEPGTSVPRAQAVVAVDAPATLSPEDLTALDDVALCRAWRQSFAHLRAARGGTGHPVTVGATVGVIVEQRQQYLDELQRRSPDGLASWLASGARASDDPLPFLRERPSH
jgi:hypothetical protein